jgi:hypothetical protein
MGPLTTIWIKTEETIDQFKDSNWVRRQGLLFYLIFGINATGETDILLLLGNDSSALGTLLILFTLLFSGLIFGMLFRVIWVNLIFYFGKIWKGQATKRNIDTVIALCLIPEIFRLLSLTTSFIAEDNLEDVKINSVVTIICAFLSLRILIIGLSRVQEFSYGISILSIVVPQIGLWLVYYSIRELL